MKFVPELILCYIVIFVPVISNVIFSLVYFKLTLINEFLFFWYNCGVGRCKVTRFLINEHDFENYEKIGWMDYVIILK